MRNTIFFLTGSKCCLNDHLQFVDYTANMKTHACVTGTLKILEYYGISGVAAGLVILYRSRIAFYSFHPFRYIILSLAGKPANLPLAFLTG